LVNYKNITVVIVDDDKDDHFFLSKAIRELVPNATLKVCFNGCELMEYFASNSSTPNLIFLDLNMPKMDGRVTTVALKNNPLYSKIPLVIFTTSESLHDRLELTQMGADDFYTKPVSAKELTKIVEKVFNRWLF
jgi:CheY-like chemotaxis protein